MTREQAFKQGFLKKAAESNITIEELSILIKRADISQLWDQGKAGLSQLFQQGKDYIANTEFNNPEHASRTALIGALGGGILGGAYTGFSNIGKREEDKSSVLGSTLRNALLGGVGGAATPYIKEQMGSMTPQGLYTNQPVNNINPNPQPVYPINNNSIVPSVNARPNNILGSLDPNNISKRIANMQSTKSTLNNGKTSLIASLNNSITL